MLENFLAFQRDKAEFSKGFTIIVGPNWSGKSTIYQGIKFALGSNERDERYSKWSDFIRTGQDHALIEVYIETPKELIGIRRTVLRGKAPYFELKRGKDEDFKKTTSTEVQNLVKSLNYNPDNQFSFVSQGKIDAMKNMKPEELCTFLEEGVGLKGLRYEILNQKNQVIKLKEDLKALKSEENSWNFELKLLEPKLKKLEKKRDLLKIKEGFEYELLWANRDKLKKEIELLEDKIEKLSVIIEGLKGDLDSFNQKIKEVNDKIEEIDIQMQKISEDIGSKKGRIFELEQRKAKWEVEKLRSNAEVERLKGRSDELSELLEEKKAKKKKIESEVNASRKKIKSLDDNISQIIKDQKEFMLKISSHQEFLDKFNKKKGELKAKQDELIETTQKITNINESIDNIFKELRDVKHQLEQNKWFMENKDQNLQQKLLNQRKNIDSRIHEVTIQLDDIKREYNKKVDTHRRLNSSVREKRVFLPPGIVKLKEEVYSRNLNAKGPIIDYLQYNDKLGFAIESVLGKEVLYSFIVGDWETFVLLKRLKDSDEIRAYCNIYLPKKERIRPHSKYEEIPGVLGYIAELIKIKNNDEDVRKLIYSKVKNCLVVEDFTTGTIMHKKHRFPGKCVTLKGEQIIDFDYVYETPYIKPLQGLLSPSKQVDQLYVLEKDINDLNDKRKSQETLGRKLDTKYREYSKKIETLPTLEMLFNRQERLINNKDDKLKERKDLNNRVEKLEEVIDNLEVDVAELKKEQKPEFFKWQKALEKFPEELESKAIEKDHWNEIYEIKHAILSNIRKAIQKQTEEFTKIDIAYKDAQTKFQKKDQQAFELFQELTDLGVQVSSLRELKLKLEEEKEELKNNEYQIRQDNLELTLDYERKENELNTSVSELEEKHLDLNKINEEIGPKVSKKEMRIRPIEEIEGDLFDVNKKLMSFAEIDDSLEVQKEGIINTLKKIAQNQSQIQKDIDEAEEAEKNLENTYFKRLNSTIKSLEQLINDKFKNSEIEAYCSIELSGIFENLGINIKAALLKEQLRDINALSGGQRSIVAICLMLSLQDIKSSPLCIFDEAEIYLDPSNAEIVYKLIQTTIKVNKIQIIMLMPKSSRAVYKIADKIIGVARNGKTGPSTIIKPKIVKSKN